MKAIGRFEIQHPVVSGVVETFTARDPSADTTVLLHLLPATATDTPEKVFLEFAPGCPGKILDSGVDPGSKRGFVVTEYPKDRKSLLLWIKSLSSLPAAKPAPAPAPAKPHAPPASDGATRMFDPSAMFGSAPTEAAPASTPPPTGDGATRMFDPAAIFGGSPSAPAPAPEAGATKMFDPSAMFGGAPSEPAPSAAPPASSRKTPSPHSSGPKRTTDPFADLKGALERASASASPAPAEPSKESKSSGEFTRRFELPKQFRNAPTRVDRTKGTSTPPEPHQKPPDGDKGVLTLMMEAYAERVDQPDGQAPAPPAAPGTTASGSDGATRMFDPSALFGAPPAKSADGKPSEPEPPAKPPEGYQPTARMPAIKRDDDEKKSG